MPPVRGGCRPGVVGLARPLVANAVISKPFLNQSPVPVLQPWDEDFVVPPNFAAKAALARTYIPARYRVPPERVARGPRSSSEIIFTTLISTLSPAGALFWR